MEWNKERIRAYRKKLGLTQDQFASLLGTSQKIISDWETGKQTPCGMSQKFLTLLVSKDIKKDIEEIKSKEQKESPLSGDAIRAFREKLSLSQTEFAEKLGRDHSTVSYWESKEISPSKRSRKALKELAEKFSIDLSKLLEETRYRSTSHDVKSEGNDNPKGTLRNASPDSHSSASRDGTNRAFESLGLSAKRTETKAQEEIDPKSSSNLDLTGEPQDPSRSLSLNEVKDLPEGNDSNAEEEASNFFDSSKDTDTDDDTDTGEKRDCDDLSFEEESSNTNENDTDSSETFNKGGANFTSSPSAISLTHDFLPEPNIRIVGAGIDILHMSFYVDINDKLLSRLSFAKAEAKSLASSGGKAEIPISLGEKTFTIKSYAHRLYPYILENGDMWLQVAEENKDSYPNVYVQMNSLYILETGADEAHLDVRSFISDNFGEITKEVVSEVEMYVDVAGEKVYQGDVDKFVSRAVNLRFYQEYGEFTGFGLGKGDIQAKVYNKKAEIKKSHKEYMYSIWDGVSKDEEVWRIEFSLSRRALKGWDVEDYDSFKALSGDIWKYLTEEWLSMREQDNENTTRRTLTELWEEVCSARDFFGKVTGAIRNNKRISEITQHISQISGLQTSISALLSKLGHDVDKQRVRKLVAARMDEQLAKKRILAKGLDYSKDLTSEEIERLSSQEFAQESYRKAVNCE
jgi:DNA-binding transcriptional regulator YiaG